MTSRRDVRYGNGAVRGLAEIVSELGARRVFLVCGGRSFEASGAGLALPDLERVAQVRRWSDFAPNTDAADLVRGLALTQEFEPDLVLGVGGGSAMDMAKLLCAFTGVTDPVKLHEAIRSGDPVAGREPRLVLAPTTSGSGSEATHFAVVYIADQKFSVAGAPLLPDVVVLDPALTLSGSRYQRATSGIDAVAQAMESLWAAGATDRSRGYARHALGHLLPAIETFVDAPDDRTARAMAIGSHLAGRAIDVSKTTAAHALAYGITKGYGVSHGHAVALTLGAFIEAHAAATPDRLQPAVAADAHAESLRFIVSALGAADPAGARARFTALAERIGLTMGLARVGVPDAAAIEALAAAVNVERLGNNPVRFSQAELTELLNIAARE
jgi:alcohol dehydrogenase class IV